ncbi:uncharacterized protein LOC144708244 isoform X2 [Wolffia australiana]
MASEEGPRPEENAGLKSLLLLLRSESNILDRVVYKNKNQHRRCFYFKSLLKVRRDVRLLLSAGLEDILSSTSQVIHGRNPAQKVHLLERLKNRAPNGKNNFYLRLLGVSRLLSQMVEPILRAAMQISSLLAKSFFMGFSLIIMSLLARIRTTVQQMLVECVTLFNKVTALSQERFSIKLAKNGIEVFREYYPPSGLVISLECAWEGDKFVLVEKQIPSNIEVMDCGAGINEVQDMQYEVLGFGSEGENPSDSQNLENDVLDSCGQPQTPEDNELNSLTPMVQTEDPKLADDLHLKRKVSFISVHGASESSIAMKSRQEKKLKLDDELNCNPGTTDTEDPFFSLLISGNVKGSLFGS